MKSKKSLRKHENTINFVRVNRNFGLLEGLRRKYKQRNQEEFICKVCPLHREFASKNELKIHSINSHDSRNNKVKIGQSFLTLSEVEVSGQSSRTVNCDMCDKQFQCVQDHHYHMRNEHITDPSFMWKNI